MSWARPERLNQVGRGEQLCWSCANADTNGCSWARNLEPVEGWDAEIDRSPSYGVREYSYQIFSCPLFIKCEEGQDAGINMGKN